MREHRERTQCSTVQNMSKGGCADIQSRLPVKVAVCIVIHLTLRSHTVLQSAIPSPCLALFPFHVSVSLAALVHLKRVYYELGDLGINYQEGSETANYLLIE